MTGIPYPPKNSIITFREPLPRKEFSGRSIKYYIRANIALSDIGLPEQEIRIVAKQQLDTIDALIKTDLKLTNAVVRCDNYSRFIVLQHSP